MNNLDNVIGYFIETDIWFQGVKQPPRKTPIILIENNIPLEQYSDEDEIQVLSIEENWYTIKKRDLVLI